MGVNLGNSSIADAKLGSNQVNKIYLGSELVWQKQSNIKALKFSSTGSQTLGLDTTKLGTMTLNFEYSVNNGSTWATWDLTTPIAFGSGVDLYLRGMNQNIALSTSEYTNFVFSTSSPVACSGNVMHLLDYTQDLTAFDTNGSGTRNLFYGCSVLTSAPELPATTLAPLCYRDMFSGCSLLEVAPDLPATEISSNCYRSMFTGCTSLINAPEILATSVQSGGNGNYVFYQMFSGCSSLTNAPVISLSEIAQYACSYMFNNCTSLTTPPALSALSVNSRGYEKMFNNCTSLNKIPALPATTVNTYGYRQMFSGCSLIKISETQSSEYPNAYTFGRVPTAAWNNMFENTGGTFTGTPTAQTYYTANEIVS